MAHAMAAMLLLGAIVRPSSCSAFLKKRGDTSLLPSYDYIVVGAGASGLTVANRLSEDQSVTVLVIEAGELDAGEDIVKIPALAGGAIGTKYDWNTTYVANDALGGRVVPIPQGKVVGGSTKLNRMVFDRGSKSDYDRWESLGASGWNWDTLLPYFKKNENFTPPIPEIKSEWDIEVDAAAHGNNGLMQVTYSPFFWPTTKFMIDAVKELDIPVAKDQANGGPIGGYFCPHNLDPKTATRSSAREAYYDNFTGRQNLHLLTGRQVTKVVTDGVGDCVKATGIEFAASKDAQTQTIGADKEVILAAGTLHTPQILQVSGIGDPALHASINVSTVVDLPAVGQNLHDHVFLAVVNTINTSLPVYSWLQNNATFAADARAQYDSHQNGPLSSPTGDFLAFLPLSTYSKAGQALSSQAAAQDSIAFLPPGAPPEVVNGYRAQHKVLNERLLANDSALLEMIWADGTIILGLQHPYSRGSLRAASPSTFDAPVADSAFLKNPLDLSLLVEGVKFTRTLVGTESVKSLQPFEVVPGANVTTDDAIADFIRQQSSTLYHPVGTCKLGPREEGGVVDTDLNVYGIEGLRVVDASIIPLLPASHLMTTVYAVAERAADIIRGKTA
ncbi:GMC oxidoreductase [Colletotrichum graminicola]|uniref:GMC oxidoreductase n=1 Tax=Colletotrichum graminicola (strain M1.001 / M2 / FGSC 10212) TaxID=645133 RepID=E3QV58_COLGM|nr:GMC oxidoreductase [Colletotrichum graminicola M1.001]EFQ34748.1 GMC oxidoreductase [Colletotrichum graminicola M1.001]WDK16884.1 GMC oxidoreductase [Colletotrichum graminicola]